MFALTLSSRDVQRPRRRLTCDSRFGDLRDEAPKEEGVYEQDELTQVPIPHGDEAVQWMQGHAW